MTTIMFKNMFSILDELDCSDDEIVESTKTDISLEFVNSKPIRIKRFIKNVNQKSKSLRVNKRTCAKNEMDDLPNSIVEAIKKKQNLTLKQILILMNLHAIPSLVLNIIHDKIQTQVRRKQVKIFHDSRIFYVSQYNWYDLKQIEMMINVILDS
jgi:hypothetical protein